MAASADPRPRRRLAVVALSAALVLTGCTTAPVQSVDPDGSQAPADPVATDAVGWLVEGGGAFVSGTTEVCDLDAGILLEDWDTVVSDEIPDAATSMSFVDGRISYATAWKDDRIGTGVADGDGTYTLVVDAEGRPVRIDGEATVVWHEDGGDAGGEEMPDTVTITLTSIPRPDYCP